MSNHESGLEELADRYPDVPRFIILKLDAQRRGIKLTENAFNAVQEPLYRYGRYSGVKGEETSKGVYPGPLILRDGTTVLTSAAAASQFENPYTIDHVEGKFYIHDNGRRIDEVDFTPRPDYYGKKTSRGVPMESIASARPQRIDIQPYRYCHFWDTQDQCKFCSFFTDLEEQRQLSDEKFPRALNVEDIYETVREALKEPGRISQINLTAGADYSGAVPFDNEVNRYIEVLQAIGRNFSGRFPSQLLAPAYTKKQVKRLYDETGLSSYCPDIEVWDENLFKWICSGKDKVVGRNEWVKRTIDAVEIFGKGNVYTNFVAGVETAQPHGFKTIDEALKSSFEGCEFFAKHGVVYLSLVWRPWKSSVFAGQKQPPLEYYVRLVKGLREIRRAYGLTSDNDDYKHCGNHGDSDLERID
ncbi:MAG: hypothetical protein FD174_2170 [Geobacteraceae bacterium]|nr:MAG: hypothetical protein FD174_2170 [Geobacteraceae bacterium]